MKIIFFSIILTLAYFITLADDEQKNYQLVKFDRMEQTLDSIRKCKDPFYVYDAYAYTWSLDESEVNTILNDIKIGYSPSIQTNIVYSNLEFGNNPYHGETLVCIEHVDYMTTVYILWGGSKK